jgi:hypothetical protein
MIIKLDLSFFQNTLYSPSQILMALQNTEPNQSMYKENDSKSLAVDFNGPIDPLKNILLNELHKEFTEDCVITEDLKIENTVVILKGAT